MIYLIFGGAASGKKEYAKKRLQEGFSEIRAEAHNLLSIDERFCFLEGLEHWLDEQPCHDDAELMQRLAEKVEDAEQHAASRLLVLLFEERGCGVVPLDRELRALRERNGKALRWLAQRADRVDRVFAGYGLCLKGADVDLFSDAGSPSPVALAALATNEERRSFMLRLYRHGASEANLRREYLGRRDCSLSAQGREALLLKREAERQYLPLTLLFCSPAKRCQETAALYFPEFKPILIPEFWERDFGELEGKTWEDMKDNGDYRSWIASSGQSAPFHMERAETFTARISAGFDKVLSCVDLALPAAQEAEDSDPALNRFAIFMHGGSLMELLRQLAARFPELMGKRAAENRSLPKHEAFYRFMLKEGQSLTLLGELSSGRLVSCRLMEVGEE